MGEAKGGVMNEDEAYLIKKELLTTFQAPLLGSKATKSVSICVPHQSPTVFIFGAEEELTSFPLELIQF